jgi:signal transduction histidine kinase
VEVAAYHIGREALTNVVRHAGARHCRLRLAVKNGEKGYLHLSIQDDGPGLSGSERAGVGLSSMRARAAELGGTCTIEAEPGAGTRVTAQLPLGS